MVGKNSVDKIVGARSVNKNKPPSSSVYWQLSACFLVVSALYAANMPKNAATAGDGSKLLRIRIGSPLQEALLRIAWLNGKIFLTPPRLVQLPQRWFLAQIVTLVCGSAICEPVQISDVE